MTPERHARVKSIFLEACELPPESRGEFVRGACDGDSAIEVEVKRLLTQHRPLPPDPTRKDGEAAAPNGVPLSDALLESSNASEFSRFPAGQIISDRYRIVSLLGEGGMGCVYRADDLTLNDTVALKFLSRRFAADPIWRRRFESEVRLARELSNPFLCRVHDIGEYDGVPILSMEYVDGETLSSLVKRVGRLTGDRAIEIARQLCIGLAAAHARGVLHRDLKPTNVMLDGRGNVRITDFGLAAFVGAVAPTEIVFGTPRYMAPEQIAGKGVNEQSDIYSLGLILYELFCGQPAFTAVSPRDYREKHLNSVVRPPAQIVPDIDPAVEAVILACLEKSPADRPTSALAVAAALPGGDLLTAALSAGQVPSPTMIAMADAGRVNRKPALTAVLVSILLLEVLVVVLAARSEFLIGLKGSFAPEVLNERARDIARRAGYPDLPANHTFGYDDASVFDFQLHSGGRHPEFEVAGMNGPLFGFRAPLAKHPRGEQNFVLDRRWTGRHTDTFALHLDSIGVVLRPNGELVWFDAGVAGAGDGVERPPFDWAGMIGMAGLEPSTYRATPPLIEVNACSDQRRAFVHSPGAAEPASPRIEAAESNGRPTFFAVLDERPAPTSFFFPDGSTQRLINRAIRQGIFLIVLIAALPVAWRNLRRSEIDTRGAQRLGVAMLTLRLIADLVAMRRIGGAAEAIDAVVGALTRAASEGLIVALFYIALERHARTYWPHSLVGWSKVVLGRLRDATLAREALIGCALGAVWAVLVYIENLTPQWLGWNARESLWLSNDSHQLRGGRFMLASLLDWLRNGMYQGMLLLLLLVVTRILVRRPAPAAILAWLVTSLMFVPMGRHPVSSWLLIGVCGIALAVYLIVHVGLIGVVVAAVVGKLLTALPLTMDMDAWYAGLSLFALSTTTLFAVYVYLQARGEKPEHSGFRTAA